MKYLKAAIALLAITATAPCFAQYNYVNTGFYTETSNFNTYMQNVNFNRTVADNINDGSDHQDAENFPRSKANVDLLTYSPSQSIRRANMAKFAQSMKKNDPSSSAAIDQIFGSNQVIDQIEQGMHQIGLNANSVADAYAFWWIVAWHAANTASEMPSRESVLAVKQQAANALLTSPQFASVSNEQKQEIAESLLVQAAMTDSYIDSTAGNPTEQAALAKAVNQGAKKMGLDLTTMDLTEQGFVPRSGKRSDAGDTSSGDADTAFAANDNGDTGKLALYGVGGVALLAGMFALGKSFGGKG